MKTLLSLLLTLMLSLPVSAREPYAYIPSVGDGYIVKYYINESGHMVYLSPSQVETDVMVPVYYLRGEFNTPVINVEFEPVKTISSPTARLKTVLNGSRRPKIIVRIPDKCGDADFIRTIEYKLSMLGLDVLDHTLAEGATTPKAIERKSGADILLDVSWLEFSNPEMTTNQKGYKIRWNNNFATQYSSSGEIGGFKFLRKGEVDNKERDKYLSKSKKKDFFIEHHVDEINIKLSEISTEGLNDEIINEIEFASCYKKNNNVVSVIFRFIDLHSGLLLCQFHLGHTDQQLEMEVPSVRYFVSSLGTSFVEGLRNRNNNRSVDYIRDPDSNLISWIDPWNKERFNTFKGSDEAAWILTYIATQLNNGEIPYAKQLNNFQSVKIADEQILEQGSSRSTTNTGYSGHGGTNYYYRFNRSYWSGGSRSTTNTTSSNTTTFKDAEYIRPQDFYGYYAPLTDKLCEELQKLLN